MRTIVLSMAASLMLANLALAADCCDPPTCAAERACCGVKHTCGTCGVPKTCKVVCEMKKVKKTVWRVECEEFCASLPGWDRGCRCGKGCCDVGCGVTGCGENVCGGVCCEDPCADLLSRKRVPPKCGKVRTRKKLVKREITCEVPTYKCVVAECGTCGGCGKVIEVESEEALPEAPAPSEAPLPPQSTTKAAPLPSVQHVLCQKIIKERQ